MTQETARTFKTFKPRHPITKSDLRWLIADLNEELAKGVPPLPPIEAYSENEESFKKARERAKERRKSQIIDLEHKRVLRDYALAALASNQFKEY